MSGSDSRTTLGVVAISFNEERDLPGFLENLVPWVDEIIIVDDGSTDSTRAIAERASRKVKFFFSPRGAGEYFSDQRNKGIQLATSDWLIHMDVDERIPFELAREILEAIDNPNFDAYHYRRTNYFLQRLMRGGGWTTWNLVHVARREQLRFSGMYHEKVELMAPERRVGQLKNFIIHMNDESYSERLRKSGIYQKEVSEIIQRANASIGYFDILFSFVAEFTYKYFWQRGFLDGTLGLIWAFHAASARMRACALAWDEQNRIPRENLEKEIQLKWKRQTSEVTLTAKPNE